MGIDEIKNDNQGSFVERKRRWPWFLILGIAALGIVGGMLYKARFTFSQMTGSDSAGGVLPIVENAPKPEKDPDRINVLLLGLRGADDPNGGLLTDSMMVVSIKKSTGRVAMISIPRDLYVKMPTLDSDKKSAPLMEKVNYSYALGEMTKRGAGQAFAEASVTDITGLYIDHVVSVNFEAFKETVDILGGIDIILDKSFKETSQFAQEIILELPAGKNHLDGDTALYYVRSRFSTNDFDRARRQQQVLLAIKDKAVSLGVLLNPVKLFQMMGAMGKNVRTDMDTGDINELLGLYGDIDTKNVAHMVLDNSEGGLLYQSISDRGAYILLPKGDNFNEIREMCKNIFD